MHPRASSAIFIPIRLDSIHSTHMISPNKRLGDATYRRKDETIEKEEDPAAQDAGRDRRRANSAEVKQWHR